MKWPGLDINLFMRSAAKMQSSRNTPSVIVLAGPNGAGKSTSSAQILRDTFEVNEFVNADLIAQGLSPFKPEGVALEAAKVMLKRIRELAFKGDSFAYETTLASRSISPIGELIKSGYRFHLFFLWLPSAEMAVLRVAERVRLGGHHVPEQTIRRRYANGLNNFFELFQPIASTWRFYDSSQNGLRLIARGSGLEEHRIMDKMLWRSIKKGVQHVRLD